MRFQRASKHPHTLAQCGMTLCIFLTQLRFSAALWRGHPHWIPAIIRRLGVSPASRTPRFCQASNTRLSEAALLQSARKYIMMQGGSAGVRAPVWCVAVGRRTSGRAVLCRGSRGGLQGQGQVVHPVQFRSCCQEPLLEHYDVDVCRDSMDTVGAATVPATCNRKPFSCTWRTIHAVRTEAHVRRQVGAAAGSCVGGRRVQPRRRG